jgi:hypothetical protein
VEPPPSPSPSTIEQGRHLGHDAATTGVEPPPSPSPSTIEQGRHLGHDAAMTGMELPPSPSPSTIEQGRHLGHDVATTGVEPPPSPSPSTIEQGRHLGHDAATTGVEPPPSPSPSTIEQVRHLGHDTAMTGMELPPSPSPFTTTTGMELPPSPSPFTTTTGMELPPGPSPFTTTTGMEPPLSPSIIDLSLSGMVPLPSYLPFSYIDAGTDLILAGFITFLQDPKRKELLGQWFSGKQTPPRELRRGNENKFLLFDVIAHFTLYSIFSKPFLKLIRDRLIQAIDPNFWPNDQQLPTISNWRFPGNSSCTSEQLREHLRAGCGWTRDFLTYVISPYLISFYQGITKFKRSKLLTTV